MEKQQMDAQWTNLYWLTVLRTQGSFTSAALRLGVSKAAMSQRIAELERVAGVALVRRTTRSVHLTEAGEQLVECTRGAFEQIANGFAGVRDSAGKPGGLLRVTAPVAFSRQQLVHRIPEFLRAFPDVRIELEMSDQLRSLSKDGFDLALRHTASPPETHVAWTLAQTRSVLVASPALMKRCGQLHSPEELEKRDCLFYPRAQGTPTWTFVAAKQRSRSRDKGRITVRVSGPFAANNSEALRDAALAGLGIALLPDFSAQSALQSGQLVELLRDWQPVESFGEYLYAVRPYAAHVPRAVSAFVDYLRVQYSNGFAPEHGLKSHG
ncbi:MAG: LysR family transcriptional regulator [Acidovorax temperans]|uniref:LysR family transcriptional regulator n=1 Tax=Acidovorax temperans TaxID=80878 RepID=UPI003918C2D6